MLAFFKLSFVCILHTNRINVVLSKVLIRQTKVEVYIQSRISYSWKSWNFWK